MADQDNDTIRKLVVATGEVTTLAGSPGVQGSTDGTGAAALFRYPAGVTSDGAGNLYVADTDNDTIRKLVIATAAVTTLAGAPSEAGAADGTGAAARFLHPWGLSGDRAGNLYVADSDNQTIRQIVLATGAVTTLAGSPGSEGSADGTGRAALFYNPAGLASDGAGNLYVTDYANHTVRKLVPTTGAVTTLAGSPGDAGSADGTGPGARFDNPVGLACDGAGNLYVADTRNDTIRKIVLATGVVTTVAGIAGQAGVVLGPLPGGLYWPYGLAFAPGPTLFISDNQANVILEAQ